MKISNPTYEAIKIRVDVITPPLKAGTPISRAGMIANNALAIGIVPQTYADLTNIKSINILVAGDVHLAEVNAEYGTNLTNNAIQAMDGINFYKDNGKVAEKGSGGGSGGSDLPVVDVSDNGSVLTVVSGEWNKATPAKELPAVSNTDNGKLLGVANGEWGKVDAPSGSGLPAVTSDDNGDVLTVVSGAWAKATPSSGGSLPAVSATDNGDVLTVVSGEWAKASPPSGSLPTITADDVNKVLKAKENTTVTTVASSQTATFDSYDSGTGLSTLTFEAIDLDTLPETITVTLNGTTYEDVPLNTYSYNYGDYDEFPFLISLAGEYSSINVFGDKTSDPVTIAITAPVGNGTYAAKWQAGGLSQGEVQYEVDSAIEYMITTVLGIPTYLDYESYAVDDLAYYNKAIYKCTTAAEYEPFDDSKWTQVTIMDIISGS